MSRGRSTSGLGYSAEVWCGRQWSEARPDTPPPTQQGQSWNSVISESARVLLLLRLRALQVWDKRQKMTSLSDGTKITWHTCPPPPPPPPPAPRLLDLVITSSYFLWPICWKEEKKEKFLSPAPPLSPFCLFITLFFPPLPPSPPLYHSQSQTAASGQGDVPLNPEEFSVGDSTGEKLIVFPSVQSTPSSCHVSPPPPPSVSSVALRVPCWFPSEAVFQLRVGCHQSP